MTVRPLLMATLVQASLLALASQATAAPPRSDEPENAADKPAAAGKETEAKKEKEEPGKPKPYKDVITAEAVSDPGVFTVHRIKSKNKVYYEIPRNELGKDFLFVTQIAKNTVGRGYGGAPAGEHVVRWERNDNRVFLREVSYDIVADASLPVA